MPRPSLSKLRAELSDIHDIEVGSQHNGWYIFRNEKGDILFSVKCTGIFDADGMRFEDDLSS